CPPPLRVGEVLERAPGTRADGVDERVELATPAVAQLVEHPLDLTGVSGVGDQSERIGAAQVRQFAGRTVEDVLRPADDGHSGTVLRQTPRGCETHPATAADDDRGGV